MFQVPLKPFGIMKASPGPKVSALPAASVMITEPESRMQNSSDGKSLMATLPAVHSHTPEISCLVPSV